MLKQINKLYTAAIEYWLVKKLRQVDFIRFCAVGGIGFAVNYGFLYLLHDTLSLPILLSQLVGAELALISNFTLHANWTYKTYKEESLWSRILKFHVTMLMGYTINTVTVVELVSKLGMYYGFALVIGSSAALLVNFWTSRYYVWGRSEKPSKISTV